MHEWFGEFVLELAVEEAREFGVKCLVARDELVAESESCTESSLLEPEDGAECSGEEDSLDACECHESFGEACVFVVDVLECPVCLLSDGWDVVDGAEESCAFLGCAHECVDEEGVGLGVDVFHHDLESVEAPCFGQLDFGHEPLGEILGDDSIGCGEECEYGLDEVLFVVGEVVEVPLVIGEVDFLCRPEGCLVPLVHLPLGGVHDGEGYEPAGVLAQDDFIVFTVAYAA